MEADDTSYSGSEPEPPPGQPKGKAVASGNASDDDSCSQDSSESSSSSSSSSSSGSTSSEEGFEGQDDILLRGITTFVTKPSDDAARVIRNTDYYMTTQYKSLCFAIDAWVKDAFGAANVDEEVGNRLGKLLSAIEETYQETFEDDAVKGMYLALVQRHQRTGDVPLAYIAHWIMFNIWKDIFELYYPRGLGDNLQDALDKIDESVARSTGPEEENRSSQRYRQWFSETMIALTMHPRKRMVKRRKEDVEYICRWHLDHLRTFFGYNETDRESLEQQYRDKIIAPAMAIHRFKTCSIFHYAICYGPVPKKAAPEDHGKRRYQHVDNLAVLAPVLVGGVYHLPLYPALVRARVQDERDNGGTSAPLVLELPTFIAHHKPASP